MKYREWKETLLEMGYAMIKNGVVANKLN